MSARSHVRRAIRREAQARQTAEQEAAKQARQAFIADIMAAAQGNGRIRVTVRGGTA